VYKKVLPIVFSAIILTALLAQPFTTVHAAEPKSECWAVIIGISDYEHVEVKDLPYSADGARELFQALSPIWGEDHLQLLLDSQATKANILAAIDWIADKDDTDDTALLFFSGHGTNDGYLAPYNAYFVATLISRNELDSRLDRLDSKRIAIILETCYAGLFEPELSDNGRVVLMSSRSDELSWETGTLEHGVFTYYILEAVKNFDGADANHDYELSAEEVFQYATPKTISLTTVYAILSQCTIQHPVISDRYSVELSLLTKFIFGVKPYLPPSTQILVLDDRTYTSTPPQLIWAPGSTHNLIVPSVVQKRSDTRYIFTSWSDGNTSVSRTISHGGAYTANYNTEYQLTITSTYGESEGAGWYQEGGTANISVVSLIAEERIKHIFTGWSGDYKGDTPTASVIMSSPKMVTANWRNEYLLTITSPYGEPEGEGWYKENEAVTISVVPIKGIIIRHIFNGWSGDFSGDIATETLTINSPKAITANWRTDYIQLYILIAGVVILVVVIIAIVRKRRKSHVDSPLI
jgi:hypothetical protein